MQKNILAALVSVLLLCQTAIAALPPLSQAQRVEMASDIISGYVISIHKQIFGNDSVYTVRMIVNEVEKGAHHDGAMVTFKYWKAHSRPNGWCGDSGQSETVKHYDSIRAYLNYNQENKTFELLWPNGFEIL